MNNFNEVLNILPDKVNDAIETDNLKYDMIQEVRLRSGQPLEIAYDNQINNYGDVYISKDDINKTLQYISDYSLYAYEDNIKQGFITIRGGHRVGLSGKVIMNGGQVYNMTDISFLNIRVAHEIIGCADKIMDFVYKGGTLEHLLIISPPGAGKTTLLRDIIRQISDGTQGENTSRKIGLIDERSEIAACYNGVPQNNVGRRTDVLDCAAKSEGMMMMLRSMSPEVIAIDEIGDYEDVKAIQYIINCGCKVIGTVHGASCEDIICRNGLCDLISKTFFKRIIVMSDRNHAGEIRELIEL